MLVSPRKNGLTSLFKEVRVFKEMALTGQRIAMVDMGFLVFKAFSYLP